MPTLPELERDFLAELHNIEFQNITFFAVRPPLAEEDIIDKLSNHYLFWITNNVAYFCFVENSDLPFKIRKRCLAAFDKFFPNGHVIGKMF